MPFSGVRISWFIWAKKRARWRDIVSACSRALTSSSVITASRWMISAKPQNIEATPRMKAMIAVDVAATASLPASANTTSRIT